MISYKFGFDSIFLLFTGCIELFNGAMFLLGGHLYGTEKSKMGIDV